MEKLLDAALSAWQNGVSTVPVELPAKTPPPGLKWKPRQTKLPTEATIRADLAGRNGSTGFAIIGGSVSGNLEIFDFDLVGEFFTPFASLAEAEAPGLIGRLARQQTQSGGFHLIARCTAATIPGSRKLAHKRIEVKGAGEHEHCGKRYTARLCGDRYFIFPVAIETRGEGGYAVSAPSPGYTILQEGESGDFHDPPDITAFEREILVRCARALDQAPPERIEDGPRQESTNSSGLRPGEDFNRRGNVLPTLLKAGWKFAGGTPERQQLTRPGKERGISGTLYDSRTLRVFSSNAPPFEQDTNYSAFAVYAMLEHGGDFTAAAREFGRQGYGDPPRAKAEEPPRDQDPGPDPKPKGGEEPKQKAEACRPHAVGWCAADLMETELPAARWAVEGILPEGLTLLAGKPKRGKSILALNLGIAITSGGKALGRAQAEQGGVLYLALEDTPRRLKARLKTMLCGRPASPRLWLYTQWPRMHEGGLELLASDIESHENLRLVIIDTLPKFRPPKPKNVDAYQWDYEIGTQIKSFADTAGVAVLVICHLRKTESEDRLDDISGTFGVTGSADGTLVLVRNTGQADGTLIITGRDVEEAELALKFYGDTLSWNVIGDANEIKSTEMKQRLFNAIRDYSAPFSPKQIAAFSGLSESYVKRLLPYLERENNVRRQARGRYEFAS